MWLCQRANSPSLMPRIPIPKGKNERTAKSRLTWKLHESKLCTLLGWIIPGPVWEKAFCFLRLDLTPQNWDLAFQRLCEDRNDEHFPPQWQIRRVFQLLSYTAGQVYADFFFFSFFHLPPKHLERGHGRKQGAGPSGVLNQSKTCIPGK